MHKKLSCVALGCMVMLAVGASEKKKKRWDKSPLEREDSRWAIQMEAQKRYVTQSKNYKKSSRAPKSPRAVEQNVDDRNHMIPSDVPPHLRSCSCCPTPVPIEGVPDPWYVRWFVCCFRER